MIMVMCALATSCSLFEHDNHISVKEDQIIGCWVKNGTQEYWRYLDSGNGVTWDEAEDVSEEESNLTFTWTLRDDELTHIFSGEMGNQAVPKVYTITEISSSHMKWEDDFGITHLLIKTDR